MSYDLSLGDILRAKLSGIPFDQLELFPLNIRDTYSRENEQRLIKVRDQAILDAHNQYEVCTELQVSNPIDTTWWWHGTSWDYIDQYYPGLLEKHGLR